MRRNRYYSKSEMDLFHRLVYAGFDVSIFAGEVTAYPGRYAQPVYHSSNNCWSPPEPNYAAGEKIERSTVVASKACDACFDRFFDQHPQWYDFKQLARQFSADDARFLRTAFKDKSKKNTPESYAAVVASLEKIKAKIYPPSDKQSEAYVAWEAFGRRIDDRVRELRSKFSDTSLREQQTRTGFAVAAALLEAATPSQLRIEVDKLTGTRQYYTNTNASAQLREDLLAWAESIGADGEIETASQALKTKLKNQAHLEGLRQIDFVPSIPMEPGETIRAWARRAWEVKFDAVLHSLVTQMEANFTKFEGQEAMVLAHVYSSIGPSDSLESRAYCSLLEMYTIRRKEAERVLYLPEGVYGALKVIAEAATSMRFERDALKAEGSTAEAASTAASLYEFDPRGAMNLTEALNAGMALAD